MGMLNVKGYPKDKKEPLGTIKAMVDLLITLGNLAQTLLSIYALVLLVHMYLLH